MQLFGKMSLLLLGISMSLCVSAEQTKVVEFNVKPGGVVHTFSEKVSKYECIFTYASQGGTNEVCVVLITRTLKFYLLLIPAGTTVKYCSALKQQWLMSVGLSEDDQLFSCSVWRPQGKSYLFFTQFKAELKGTKIEYANAFSETAVTGQRDVPLKPDEFTVGESTVTQRDGKFSAQLSKLTVIGRTRHEEL
uniref:Myeloid-derived growth factor n=2 Tax=Poecilia latipinna TaxID=48699 RepID=A0A3B3TJ32_9TELE